MTGVVRKRRPVAVIRLTSPGVIPVSRRRKVKVPPGSPEAGRFPRLGRSGWKGTARCSPRTRLFSPKLLLAAPTIPYPDTFFSNSISAELVEIGHIVQIELRPNEDVIR